MSHHKKKGFQESKGLDQRGTASVFYPGEVGEESLRILPSNRDMLMDLWREEVSTLLSLRPCSLETFVDHICHAVMKRMQLAPGEQELVQQRLEALIEASPNLIDVLQDLLLYSASDSEE